MVGKGKTPVPLFVSFIVGVFVIGMFYTIRLEQQMGHQAIVSDQSERSLL